ncbi:MAG: hypothetical protein JOZ16_06530 [Methylobacteriaceae bacterium]|nr:hypothetical protein [Methylobacteriaceae bacterium]MBV9841406.1 hypothetical protein [Sphingomonadaceae bacterium]
MKPVPRPAIRAVSFNDARNALDPLITVARGDTGSSTRVADFLLAWWNGPELGHFPIIHIANVDAAIAEDMLIILAFLGQHGVRYADFWGRREDISDLIDAWRPVG